MFVKKKKNLTVLNASVLHSNVKFVQLKMSAKFVMVLLVIMGLVLFLLETVMDPVDLYW